MDPTRRSLLRGSVALATAVALARPSIANAAATTATAWWDRPLRHRAGGALFNNED